MGQGSNVEIEISDNGRGIRPAFLPRIFDRFAQDINTGADARKGLGLGLAIVYGLVQAHGGTIRVTSAGEDRGSTFTVQFPVIADRPAEQNAGPVGDLTSNGPPHPIAGTRFLVVDDDADARELLQSLLTSEGAIVETVDTVRAAVDILNRQPPDVLLTDLNMANDDGYALVRTLRLMEQQEDRPRIFDIAVTAFATSADRAKTDAGGFDGHVAKPFDPSAIVRIVAGLKPHNRAKPSNAAAVMPGCPELKPTDQVSNIACGRERKLAERQCEGE